MADVKIGMVTHYYDRIGVGIVKLNAPLHVGDTIKVLGKNGEFTQKVESMQLEHQIIESAKRGGEVGIKFDQKVREKDGVFKV